MVTEATPAADPYVVVVGGANVDIEGRSSTTIQGGDSNPGTVQTSAGGVGRNVAENLARLLVPTHLVTVLGRDPNGDWLRAETEQAGVDLDLVVWAEDLPTPTYLSILDDAGELNVAINDMEALELLDPRRIQALSNDIGAATAVVVDCNLAPEALAETVKSAGKAPLFVDPVSLAKGDRILPHLAAVHTLKANRHEAELLSGMAIDSPADLHTATSKLRDHGVRRVVVSLGADGAFYDDGETHGSILAPPGTVKSATGAGDASMAGLVYAQFHGHSLNDGARLAMAAATLTIRSEHTVTPDLSVARVLALVEAELG